MFVAFLLLFTLQAPAAQIRNWWTLDTERDSAQRGHLEELLARKKVYLNVTLGDTRTNSVNSIERNDIIQAVKEVIVAQRDLKIVTYPEEAEFAILVHASTKQGVGEQGPNFSLRLEAEIEVSIEAFVLVPGTRQRDGTRVPRIIWDASIPNAQTEAASAARFTVNGFFWELKKFRRRK
jgi:hypothetical protein